MPAAHPVHHTVRVHGTPGATTCQEVRSINLHHSPPRTRDPSPRLVPPTETQPLTLDTPSAPSARLHSPPAAVAVPGPAQSAREFDLSSTGVWRGHRGCRRTRAHGYRW